MPKIEETIMTDKLDYLPDPVVRMRASKEAYEKQQTQAGHKAGIAFTTYRADYRDLLILRAVADIDDDDDELLDVLYSQYEDRYEIAAEFNSHLFGVEDAKPSDQFVGAFVRAALEALEHIAEQAEK
jgi:hypothetical protein